MASTSPNSFLAGLLDLTVCKASEGNTSDVLTDCMSCKSDRSIPNKPGNDESGIELAPNGPPQTLSDFDAPIRINNVKPTIVNTYRRETLMHSPVGTLNATEQKHSVTRESSHKPHSRHLDSSSPTQSSPGPVQVIRHLEELDDPNFISLVCSSSPQAFRRTSPTRQSAETSPQSPQQVRRRSGSPSATSSRNSPHRSQR